MKWFNYTMFGVSLHFIQYDILNYDLSWVLLWLLMAGVNVYGIARDKQIEETYIINCNQFFDKLTKYHIGQ